MNYILTHISSVFCIFRYLPSSALRNMSDDCVQPYMTGDPLDFLDPVVQQCLC